MTAPSCNTCRYAAGDDSPHRTCRRNAPAVSLGGPVVARWPLVRPDDWCGEYARERQSSAALRAASAPVNIVTVTDPGSGRPTVLPPLGPMPERDSW